MQPINTYKGLHIVRNEHMHRKQNKTQVSTFIGSICIEICLTQRKKVSIHGASQGCPSIYVVVTSFPCGKPPVMTDLHVIRHARFIKIETL
jgi:hypothetical protein